MEAVSYKTNILKEISNMLKNIISLDNYQFMELSFFNSDNRVYGICIEDTNVFFSKKSELFNYLKENNLDKSEGFIVEYIGEQANRDNVIRVIKGNNINLYSIINDSSYFKLNRNISLKSEIPTWDLVFGNITEYYKNFDKNKVKMKQY